MRVAYIFMRFPLPSETFAARDVKALRRRGVDVAAYSLRKAHPARDAMLRERGLEGMPTMHATPGRAAAGLAFALRNPLIAAHLLGWIARRNAGHLLRLVNGLWFFPMALHIFGRLREHPPDVVHLFWGHYPALVGFLVQEYLPAVPVSLFLGAYDLEQDFGGTSDVLRRADAVFTHARTNVAAIAALGELAEEDIRVVHRGIALDLIDEARAGQKRQPGLVMTAGRLIAEKGMDDVIRAFAAVRRTHPNAQLAMLGEGPERQSLETLAQASGESASVTFHGHLPEAEVAAMLARADAFLLLSRKSSERLPNALKEAMAAGCMVVTTATPGIEELVDEGRSGYIVPVNDPNAAANRVRRVLDEPDRHDAMRAEARRTIEERFEVGTSMEQYIRAWREIAR